MKSKKALIVFSIASLFLLGPATQALAQTSAAQTSVAAGSSVDYSSASQEQLLKIIADLQAKIRALTAGSLSANSTSMMGKPIDSKGRIEFKQELKTGYENEDVRKLQQVLATDKAIYPEGLTTGFFGPRTGEALKKFQSKFELEVTGELDSSTKDLLNKILQARGVEKEIPPGLLIAPGLKERLKIKIEDREDKKEKFESKLKIEVETKSHDKSKVKVEYRNNYSRAKRVFLINSTDHDFIISELVKKLGLSESAVESAISFDSDDDGDDNDEDSDNDDDDEEDDEEDSDDDEDEDDNDN